MAARAEDEPPPLLPPTDREFDAMVRRHARDSWIPLEVKTIEKWIAAIKADPTDLRNRPNVRRSKTGETYIAMATDLDATLEHCAGVMRKFRAGQFELALSSHQDLWSRVQEINNRVRVVRTRVRGPGAPKGAGRKARLLAELEALIAEGRKPLDAAKTVLQRNGETANLPGRAKYLLRVRRGAK
jgi:hypothetical protein